MKRIGKFYKQEAGGDSRGSGNRAGAQRMGKERAWRNLPCMSPKKRSQSSTGRFLSKSRMNNHRGQLNPCSPAQELEPTLAIPTRAR